MEYTNVLGVQISSLNMQKTLNILENLIYSKGKGYICISGVHGIMESQVNLKLKEIHNKAYLVTPDGMPMVWLSKLAGHKEVDRVYGPDLMLEVCKMSEEKGYKHFLYGGNTGVPELLETRLKARFPRLDIVGTYSPPFRALTEEEDQEIVDMINRSGAQIVWVGLSTPKQEFWMAAHTDRLNANVLIGVGAAFDFHAGLKQQAPRWVQRSGFEWLFRMVTEPKRLWKRYMYNNPRFVLKVLQQQLGLKKYPLD